MTVSALYRGTVTHERSRPRRHRLDYRVFWLLLDLDEIDELAGRLTVFSRNRWNLLSFFDSDYGPRPRAGKSETTLRADIEAHLRAAGITPDGGRIALLTMPRVLGYAFNPLSVYFCWRGDGALIAIVYEVTNTFGERHAYVAAADEPDDGEVGDGPVRQKCAKRFYVSPFLDMDLEYEFRVSPPAERVAVSILVRGADGPVLTAALEGGRVALSDGSLLRACLVYPLLTFKVVAGIYWEALFIRLKGIRVRRRPAPPGQPETVAPRKRAFNAALHATDA